MIIIHDVQRSQKLIVLNLIKHAILVVILCNLLILIHTVSHQASQSLVLPQASIFNLKLTPTHQIVNPTKNRLIIVVAWERRRKLHATPQEILDAENFILFYFTLFYTIFSIFFVRHTIFTHIFSISVFCTSYIHNLFFRNFYYSQFLVTEILRYICTQTIFMVIETNFYSKCREHPVCESIFHKVGWRKDESRISTNLPIIELIFLINFFQLILKLI